MNILYIGLIGLIAVGMIADYRHYRKSGGSYINHCKPKGHVNNKGHK